MLKNKIPQKISKHFSNRFSQFSNFEIPYNIFLWLALVIFNLTFSVNWFQALFYLATSGLLALILGNVILRRFSVKTLEYFILIVFVFANLILTFFKQFELFFALYYLTYCLIFVRLFISFRNRLSGAKVWKRITRRSLRAVICFGLLITLPFSYFFITDPFSNGSTINKPYSEYLQNGQIGLNKNQNLRAFNNPFSKALGYLKSGGHILGANFVKEAGFETTDLNEIINQTHNLRFGPNVPYIISGGHFSVFYPRSLGIFYHATLDPNLSQNQKDWQNRQAAYLKTTAFALDAFAQCGDLYTTIVPLGENSITCIQIYHYPSDSLYSVLFALQNLLDNSQYLDIFYPNQPNKTFNSQNSQNSSIPNSSKIDSNSQSSNQNFSQTANQNLQNLISNSFSSSIPNQNIGILPTQKESLTSFQKSSDNNSTINSENLLNLNNKNPNSQSSNPQNTSKTFKFGQTQTYTKALLENNRENLQNFWQKYKNKSFDQKTGLIKLGVELSGTKDIGLQNGSFYDNVIFWRTWQLMQNLGLEQIDQIGLQSLKERIIQTFWNESLGIFAEDQSVECGKSCYSSDWLVILLTGFLRINEPHEKIYFDKSVDFIINNKIDQPFPLRYHNDDRPDKTYPLVRLTNHEYAGTAIWSYWGLEYIKTLYLLDSFSNSQNSPREGSKTSSGSVFSQSLSTSSAILLTNSANPNSVSSNSAKVEITNSPNSTNSKNSAENPQNQTTKPNYKQIADNFLAKYQENILKYGGFPEVYDSRGNMMEANLYRSVVKTGWIINWEQARAMGNSKKE